MDASTLRSLQTPLKQAYKDDPTLARVVMQAEAEICANQPACSVHTAAGKVVAGLHPAAGGDGTQACSGDMLLQALVACSGVTFSAVAIALGIPIQAASVRASGEMDFRGTLGVDRTVPVGLTAVELVFNIESTAPDDQLAKLVELAERYCVVLQSLTQPAPFRCTWQRSGD